MNVHVRVPGYPLNGLRDFDIECDAVPRAGDFIDVSEIDDGETLMCCVKVAYVVWRADRTTNRMTPMVVVEPLKP